MLFKYNFFPAPLIPANAHKSIWQYGNVRDIRFTLDGRKVSARVPLSAGIKLVGSALLRTSKISAIDIQGEIGHIDVITLQRWAYRYFGFPFYFDGGTCNRMKTALERSV